MSYGVVHSGDANTTGYRAYLTKDGKPVSFFHDVPLVANAEQNIFNMVVEIPRGTKAKLEIATGLTNNPIKQDVKNGKLRFVDDVYPYSGYIWNYGAFPQTWEYPGFVNPDTGARGDNDPLDVVEIGTKLGVRGEIKQVKVLGALCLIDEGETDWKIIAIDVNDPLAHEFNDVDDLHQKLPGFNYATYEWFRTYKMPTGKPPNTFAFDGEVKNKEYALKVIQENHEFWKQVVVTGEIPKQTEKYTIAAENTSLDGSVARVDEFTPQLEDFVAVLATETPLTTGGIQAHVEQQQRASPHGVAQLSAAIVSLARAAARGASEGVNGLVEVLKDAPLAAVYNSGSADAIATNDKNHYTVHFHADSERGLVVFGVYQKISPNPVFFNGSADVHAAGLDLVAAAYASNGVFTYTTRYGVFSFTAAGQVENPAVPEVASDNLLAVKAPLAFFN